MNEEDTNKLHIIASKVDKIYSEVVGDPDFGNPGVIGRQKEHTHKLIELDLRINQNFRNHDEKINALQAGIKERSFKRGVIWTTVTTAWMAIVGAFGWLFGKPALGKILIFLGFIKP